MSDKSEMDDLKAGQAGDEEDHQGAFEALETDFQEVLVELVGDKSLDKFRVEYEKLHRALKKSHESEKRLIKRCRELNAEIVGNAAKVQTALKLSHEDQKTIATLKKEIDKAWKMVDASHEKEAQATETIQKLKQEIGNLTKLVETGAGLSVGQEHSLKELIKRKEELEAERDYQSSMVTNLRTEITDLLDTVHKLEGEKIDAESEHLQLMGQLKAKNDEIEKEQRRKVGLETDLRTMRQTLDARQSEIKEKHANITENQDRIQRLERQLKEQRQLNETAQKDLDTLFTKHQKAIAELNEQQAANAAIQSDNLQQKTELKGKTEALEQMERKEMHTQRVKDKLQKKTSQLEHTVKEVEASKINIRLQVESLERELESFKHVAEVDRRQLEDLQRERDMLNKLLVKEGNNTQAQIDALKIFDAQKKNLEQEIVSFKRQGQRQRKEIYDLEKEREQYLQQAAEVTQKYAQAVEEVKMRDVTITDLQKTVAEMDGKLKQQQNLYEAVRADRNTYSKNLIEAQDEVAEMRRKYKILTQQIEQLREEVATKDRALVTSHFDHLRITKERDSNKNDRDRVQEQIELAEQTIGSQQAEIQKLNHIISEAEAERQSQKKDYDRVKDERDILAAQLQRRTDELALLQEKIKVQQSALNAGESAYNQRLDDLRVVKLKVKERERELALLKSHSNDADALKQRVYSLERQLLQERTKVKALSEELENPINIHRWRKLEGSDPAAHELVLKTQMLQKRLIAKTEECVDKELQLQEKHSEIEKLQQQLERMPGQDAAMQLQMLKGNLKEKTKQLKSLMSQLNLHEVAAANHKRDLEALQKELQSMQQKYYAIKRKERQGGSDRASASEGTVLPRVGGGVAGSQKQVNTVGGGFNTKAYGSPDSRGGAGGFANVRASKNLNDSL